MKKISILLLLVFMLSGCELFDVNASVCEYPLDPVSYEITYNAEDITRFTIIEIRDYTNYKEAYFEKRKTKAEESAEALNGVDGLKQDVSIDGKVISIYLEVDFAIYDIDKDEMNVINLPLKQKDFTDVKTLRKFFVNKGYHCDEIVDSKFR